MHTCKTCAPVGCRDLQDLDDTTSLGWGLMVVDLVVAMGAIVWSYFLLVRVTNIRHSLYAVFLLIPTAFCRTLAERQVKVRRRAASAAQQVGCVQQG